MLIQAFKMAPLSLISQNMSGGSLYLPHVLGTLKPDVLFMQENNLKTEDLQMKVNNFGYKCESNVDVLNPHKPGTAVVWKDSLPPPRVQTIVERRLQAFNLGSTTWLNIYAPSGSNNKRERDDLFSQEMFQYLAACGSSSLPWLVGDWNCLTQPS